MCYLSLTFFPPSPFPWPPCAGRAAPRGCAGGCPCAGPTTRSTLVLGGKKEEKKKEWRKKGRRNGGRKEGGMERNDSYNQFFLIPSFYSPLTFCADVVLVHSVEVLHRRVEDVRRVTQVVCTHDRGVERHPVERRDRLLVEPLLRLIYRRALERGGT